MAPSRIEKITEQLQQLRDTEEVPAPLGQVFQDAEENMIRGIVRRGSNERRAQKAGETVDTTVETIAVPLVGPKDRWAAMRDAGMNVARSLGFVDCQPNNSEYSIVLTGRTEDVAVAADMLTTLWTVIHREQKAWRKTDQKYASAYKKGIEEKDWSMYHALLNAFVRDYGSAAAYIVRNAWYNALDATKKQGAQATFDALNAQLTIAA